MSNFDPASEHYDRDFSFSRIGEVQRTKVWDWLRPVLQLQTKMNILELNCGTGVDALGIAEMGHKILATDISPGMIQVAKGKLKEGADSPTFQVMDINVIGEAVSDDEYDLVFSNFGGLNCLSPEQLRDFGLQVSSKIKGTGRFVAVLMPRYPLLEVLTHLLKGRFGDINKKKQPIDVNVSGASIRTWYYSPKEFAQLMGRNLQVRKIKPIGFFMPPSYMEALTVRYPTVFAILKKLETYLSNRAWQAPFADHFYMEFGRR